MLESNKRIQFITDYISSYEERIKLLNSNGLFDAAKLFELFAVEVGSLYFNKKTQQFECRKIQLSLR